LIFRGTTFSKSGQIPHVDLGQRNPLRQRSLIAAASVLVVRTHRGQW
jgi:hypothetical protein